ncbi:DUF4349 domain-containing protein [Cellulomonas fengjieae]|uniref:DUF4349 domain-containing protein n=1 Tax=Cellulomonas fengjieae TaxID=2819978 RepID=A0ABS3SDD7_9CELL|nr:DUF4349 domain-containing protein [Cellulomonas fengjieae]MBO3083763.1 DUF4349 domain-containing protein [Cellulomonas fengjieae]QVI64941.1 DUF4349 domain-containing protein [Cellulomonas fengjieae]
MTPTTSRPRNVRTRAARLGVAGIIALSALLSACSAGDDGASADMQSESLPDSGAVGADEGGGDQGASAQAPEGSVAPAASTAGANRQVVQTGDVTMSVEDPRSAADAIVRLAEDAGGRIDDRVEQAQTETEIATAQLTLRLPAATVSSTLVALRDLGDVEKVNLAKKDVTEAAQDLDARIHAMELSVSRMTALLATATTHDDIVAAEDALTQRETALEQLRSQRAGIAEQVSLSTIRVALVGPDLPPYVEPAAPPTGPQSFVEGLVTGWGSLVDVVSGGAIVLGVLLPWLAFGGAVGALALAGVRWVRRRRGRTVVHPLAAGPVVEPTQPH